LGKNKKWEARDVKAKSMGKSKSKCRSKGNADSHQWLAWKLSDRVAGEHRSLRGVLSSARGGEE